MHPFSHAAKTFVLPLFSVLCVSLPFFNARAVDCFEGTGKGIRCPNTPQDLSQANACLVETFIQNRKKLAGGEGSSEAHQSNLRVRETLQAIDQCSLDPNQQNIRQCLGPMASFLSINSQIPGGDRDDPNAGGLGFDIPIGEYYKKYAQQTQLTSEFKNPQLLTDLANADLSDATSTAKADLSIQNQLAKDPAIQKGSIIVLPGTSQLIASLDEAHSPATGLPNKGVGYFYVAYKEQIPNTAPPQYFHKFLIVSVNNKSQGEKNQVSMVSVDPITKKTYFGNYWRTAKISPAPGPTERQIERRHIVQRCIHCHSDGIAKVKVGRSAAQTPEEFEILQNRYNAALDEAVKEVQEKGKKFAGLAEVSRLDPGLEEVKLGKFEDADFERLCLKPAEDRLAEDKRANAHLAKQELRELGLRRIQRFERVASCLKEGKAELKCATCHNGTTRGILRPSLFVVGVDIFDTSISAGRMPPHASHLRDCTPIATDCLRTLYFDQVAKKLVSNGACASTAAEAVSHSPQKKGEGTSISSPAVVGHPNPHATEAK